MPQPAPTPAVVAELGYTEVVKLGEAYAVELGYQTPALREAEEISRGRWRVRFGVGSGGKLLELELDATRREVVKTTELAVTPLR